MQSLSNNLHNQRGAIGLFGLLTLLLAIVFTVLAVDSGRLWMQQRKLQSIADIAAMSASRQVGCSASAADVTTAAHTAAANNGFAGQLTQSPNQVALGSVATNGGLRVFSDDNSTEAVFVRATQEVPSSLVAGGMFGNTITLSAEAVSISNSPIAAFSAGSFAANLSTEDSTLLNGLLGGILGSPLNLSALSYEGIASTQLTLQDMLAVSGDIGTVDELLDTDMQIADLLEVFANAAGQNAAADLQAVSAMGTIAGATVRNASLKLGDIVAVTTPDSNAAATANLNALSLITAAAIIANGENAIALPLAVNVLSISSINGQVTFTEPPQIAIGPAAGDGEICTMVRTAQVRAYVGVLVDIPLLARIDLALALEVAQGSAGLRSITQQGDSSEVRIEATPGIASLDLTNNAGTGAARISTLDQPPLLPSIPIADIELDLPVQPAAMQPLDFTVDHPVDEHLPQTQTAASSLGESLENALSDPDALDVTILSAIHLGLVNSVITTVISPLLGEIGRVLLDPLLNLLGIQVGGMDVKLEGLEYYQAKPLVI